MLVLGLKDPKVKQQTDPSSTLNVHTLSKWLSPSVLPEKTEQRFLRNVLKVLLQPHGYIRHVALTLQDFCAFAIPSFRQQTCRNLILPQETGLCWPPCLAPRALPSWHATGNTPPKSSGHQASSGAFLSKGRLGNLKINILKY